MTVTQNGTGINVNPEALSAKYAEIVEIDEQLAAASGSTSLGKRAISNSLASEYAEMGQPLVDGVVARLNDAKENGGIEALIGVFTALEKAVNDAFEKEMDEFLTAKVEENKTDAPALSDEQIDTLTKQARELREQYNALRSILEMFGMDVASVPVPKRLTGSRGKRGPRTLSSFDYSVDGQARTKSQNTLSSIANTVCGDLGWKTKDLRTFIQEQGIDISNPPDEWSVTLPAPNGKVISAVKSKSEDVFESSDEDEEETGDEDNE